jgi:hypothetical protein
MSGIVKTEETDALTDASQKKIFVDLNDQFAALKRHFEQNGGHSTADEVINEILLDQFYDLFDPGYEPEATTQDWRYANLGTRYGTLTKLIKDKLITCLEYYRKQTGASLYCYGCRKCTSFGGLHKEGMIVLIGECHDGRRRDR